MRSVGKYRFKGFERAVEVFELISEGNSQTATPPWGHLFQKGLDAFQNGHFAAARQFFHQTLEAKPEDGPSQFYLEQIEQFEMAPPPPSWNGEIDLKEK